MFHHSLKDVQFSCKVSNAATSYCAMTESAFIYSRRRREYVARKGKIMNIGEHSIRVLLSKCMPYMSQRCVGTKDGSFMTPFFFDLGRVLLKNVMI